MLVDTHVHLNHEDLAGDLRGVLQRARDAGVTDHIIIGYDLASSARATALAEGPPPVETGARLWASVGVHPHDAAHWGGDAAARLRAWTSHPRVVAVGEIGLDFYRDLSPREAQRAAFAAQLDIAAEAGLPVVIHCRDAYDETLDMLEARMGAGNPVIILHCFQGVRSHAERAWARGWLLGIGGAVTFKNQEGLRDVVRAAPRDSLLLETDAPYLSPAPLRGRYPNEPARVALVAQKVAELRDEPVARVAATTTNNARRAFPRLVSE